MARASKPKRAPKATPTRGDFDGFVAAILAVPKDELGHLQEEPPKTKRPRKPKAAA